MYFSLFKGKFNNLFVFLKGSVHPKSTCSATYPSRLFRGELLRRCQCNFMPIASGNSSPKLRKITDNNAVLLLLRLHRADLVLGGSYMLKQFALPFRVRVASFVFFHPLKMKPAPTSCTPSTHHNGLQYQTPLQVTKVSQDPSSKSMCACFFFHFRQSWASFLPCRYVRRLNSPAKNDEKYKHQQDRQRLRDPLPHRIPAGISWNIF